MWSRLKSKRKDTGTMKTYPDYKEQPPPPRVRGKEAMASPCHLGWSQTPRLKHFFYSRLKVPDSLLKFDRFNLITANIYNNLI